ncbi:MAG: PKD domain-containing protein [Candidatus Humimicrobiaceae bacterium]
MSDSSRLKGHGDGIYQWSYETGSYLNYTEFTGYEVKILSSDPLILAMRSEEGGVNAGWYLVCYNPLKLPFNFIPEIKIDYSPDQIYSDTTLVKFVCDVKNLSVEFGLQNISYQWDFGDGEKGSGKEVTHIYEKSGNYNVSVSVKIGDSLDSSIKSEQITVLETPDVELIAAPEFYSEVGLEFSLECKSMNAGTIGYVEWDFGDGLKGNGKLVSHAYETGSYIAMATIYNYDKSV